MATSELIEALHALAHERKIDELYLIDRLESSLAKSYQHILDLEYDARVTIDRITGMRRFLQSSSESFIEFTEFRMIERIKNFKSAPE